MTSYGRMDGQEVAAKNNVHRKKYFFSDLIIGSFFTDYVAFCRIALLHLERHYQRNHVESRCVELQNLIATLLGKC